MQTGVALYPEVKCVEIWRFDDWVAFDAESITAVFVSHYQQDVRAVVGRWHSVGVFRVGLNM